MHELAAAAAQMNGAAAQFVGLPVRASNTSSITANYATISVCCRLVAAFVDVADCVGSSTHHGRDMKRTKAGEKRRKTDVVRLEETHGQASCVDAEEADIRFAYELLGGVPGDEDDRRPRSCSTSS